MIQVLWHSRKVSAAPTPSSLRIPQNCARQWASPSALIPLQPPKNSKENSADSPVPCLGSTHQLFNHEKIVQLNHEEAPCYYCLSQHLLTHIPSKQVSKRHSPFPELVLQTRNARAESLTHLPPAARKGRLRSGAAAERA